MMRRLLASCWKGKKLNDTSVKCALKKRFHFTRHAIDECFSEPEPIEPEEVIEALANYVEVVEDYRDDPRGHSCLVLTFESGKEDKPLHVLVRLRDPRMIIVITVYRPDPTLWSSDWKKRRW